MVTLSRNITTAIALLAISTSVVLQEFVHHDVVETQTAGRHVLATHACGTIEHHKPLDAMGLCPGCNLSFKQKPTLSSGATPGPDLPGTIISASWEERSPFNAVFPHFDRRGPPRA